MVKVHLVLKGIVQGVFFRSNTCKKADKIKLDGFVRNIDDGSVEIVAQGDKDKVDQLVEYCIGGCERGLVEDVDIDYSDEEEEFEGFEIRR